MITRILILIIVVNFELLGQVNIQGERIFSFFQDTLEVKDFYAIKDDFNAIKYKIECSEEQIVVLKEKEPIDTLEIVSYSEFRIEILQHSSDRILSLIKSVQTINNESITKFLNQNIRIANHDAGGISCSMYYDSTLQKIVDLNGMICNTEVKYDIQNYSFGTVINVSRIAGDTEDLTILKEAFLIDSLSELKLIGRSLQTEEPLVIERVNVIIPEVNVEEHEIIGKYLVPLEFNHLVELENNKALYYQFIFKEDGEFEFIDTNRNQRKEGKWDLVKIDNYSIVQLLIEDVKVGIVQENMILEELNNDSLTMSIYECDLGRRDIMRLERVD